MRNRPPLMMDKKNSLIHQGTHKMKHLVVALAAGASLLAMGSAQAESKVLTVGGYGGSFETLMKELIIPEFEAKHNVEIRFVPGNSTENLARLQAQIIRNLMSSFLTMAPCIKPMHWDSVLR